MIFPLAPFDEGHTGVALFMVLSGYLFAKLLDGKKVRYGAFFWNRFIRLAPLLLLVMTLLGVIKYLKGESVADYLRILAEGLVLPSWPMVWWSLTAEIHFYVILPWLIALIHRWRYATLLFVLCALLVRTAIYLQAGEVQYLAYYTIVGRIDQFLFGIFAFQCRDLLRGRHAVAAAAFLGFSAFYYAFDLYGGLDSLGGTFPDSGSALWIVLPTVEGAAYGILIAYYDSSFAPRDAGFSRLIGRAGAYSYSIYLLHSFVVTWMSRMIDRYVIDLSNFYVALAFSFLAFLLMIPIGYLSYRFVERPCLRLRKPYLVAIAGSDGTPEPPVRESRLPPQELGRAG